MLSFFFICSIIVYIIWSYIGDSIEENFWPLYLKVYRYVESFTLEGLPVSATARDAANRVPDQVWQKLVQPLDIITCLKLEHLGRPFQRNIYCGQRRLVWDKYFFDSLSDEYQINSMRKHQPIILKLIASKISPYCCHVTLKIFKLTQVELDVLKSFTNLKSLYLKVYQPSTVLKLLLTDPEWLTDNLESLRFSLKTLQSNVAETITDTFCDFIDRFQKLRSLEIWKGKGCFSSALEKLKDRQLEELSLYCDDDGLKHLGDFGENYRNGLKGLYIRWQVNDLHRNNLYTFSDVLGKFKSFDYLELQLNWTSFSKCPKKDCQVSRKTWDNFVSSKTLLGGSPKLSIDIQHTNFQSPVNCSEIVCDLTKGASFDLLRIVASEGYSVIPLVIDTEKVEALEINFKFLKTYAKMGVFMDPDEVPFSEYNNTYRTVKRDQEIIFGRFTNAEKVFSLRLVNCPFLYRKLLNHIADKFPNLVNFQVEAFSAAIYNKDFVNELNAFVVKMRYLRVIKLMDSFEKPNLANIVDQMAVRARSNPAFMYVFHAAGPKKVPLVNSYSRMANFRVHY